MRERKVFVEKIKYILLVLVFVHRLYWEKLGTVTFWGTSFWVLTKSINSSDTNINCKIDEMIFSPWFSTNCPTGPCLSKAESKIAQSVAKFIKHLQA